MTLQVASTLAPVITLNYTQQKQVDNDWERILKTASNIQKSDSEP